MVVLAGMPESVCVLEVPTPQALVSLSAVRRLPPVVTKLMWPVSRTKRVIACAPASRAAPKATSASNARRHPRDPVLGKAPRMPRLDGSLMRKLYGAAAQHDGTASH